MFDLSIDKAIAIATLSRPPVNAINDEWVGRLNEVIDEVEAREEIAVLWIRSGERLFCAGADLDLMRSRFDTPEGRDKMIAFVREIQAVYARLENSRVISVAELGGAAMGGGMELALACDFRVAADSAKLGLPEARLGLLPGAGGTQRMTQLCGAAVSKRLILGAEIVDGTTAEALGLAHWVAPAAELEQVTRDIVERIAALPAHALAQCKACIADALDPGKDGFETEIQGTALLLASDRTQTLVRGFLEGAADKPDKAKGAR